MDPKDLAFLSIWIFVIEFGLATLAALIVLLKQIRKYRKMKPGWKLGFWFTVGVFFPAAGWIAAMSAVGTGMLKHTTTTFMYFLIFGFCFCIFALAGAVNLSQAKSSR